VRQGVLRRQQRVREILHTLPPAAQQAILESFEQTAPPPEGSTVGQHRQSECTTPLPAAVR
jgi:phospholipid/cholesterol/gamma-HCH transport system ATP-binding protein